jgi:ABC-type multidrug transport system fused ATPase/permease subunit
MHAASNEPTDRDAANKTFALLKRIWRSISHHRRNQLLVLLGLMTVSSFAEMISLGAVVPFLGVLIAPDHLFQNPGVVFIVDMLGITSANQLLLLFSIAFALIALAAGAIRVSLFWASSRLAFASGADLSIEIYRRTLYQPYRVHAARNSSEVISGIRDKTNAVAFGVFLPALTLISSVAIITGIVLMLLVIDTTVASIAALTFGLVYGLISMLTRRNLLLNSRLIADQQPAALQALHEGLGGIRDVLLNGTQRFYCEIYRSANHSIWKAQHNLGFMSGSPKFIMEALGVALITILAYVLSNEPEGISRALPLLGVLALGAQRLLPAIQQGYASWSSIIGTQASLSDVLELLDQPLPRESSRPDPAPLIFQRDICFENVRFRYVTEGPWVLDGINFTIKKGARVGFIGRTGNGKSTTLDLLMGLLDPNEGRILVDGSRIDGERRRAWQKNIAHVPQNIYLADSSMAENIAFGVSPDAIDMERVRNAARQAQIAEFIESSTGGYGSFVGERGVLLSGGQRQRIGIARALYKQATVLVFDEATSALDNESEQAVLNAINCLDRHITILIIAHRMTSVEHCDTIIELKNGSTYART